MQLSRWLSPPQCQRLGLSRVLKPFSERGLSPRVFLPSFSQTNCAFTEISLTQCCKRRFLTVQAPTGAAAASVLPSVAHPIKLPSSTAAFTSSKFTLRGVALWLHPHLPGVAPPFRGCLAARDVSSKRSEMLLVRRCCRD